MPDEPAYDDGSEIVVVTPQDDPPSGEYVDAEELIHNLTDEEMAAGQFLGEVIDVDDDEDDGSQWGSFEEPTMTADDFRELG